jgi:3-carboxy-cis,cis-muconate cycloisomerase
MRPSSSPSEQRTRPAPGLFDEVLARGPAREAVGDRAWLAAMLRAEAALAAAQAEVGLVPEAAAAAIAGACDPDRYDLGALARAAAGPGNPVLPLVGALREAVGGEAARYVHSGATSQDILDTAAMLVTRDALGVLVADLDGAAAAAARLARAHRDTPMAGRTLLQYARPVTFGLTAAGWLDALAGVAGRLAGLRRAVPAAQLGGAAGTMDGWGPAGIDLAGRFADRLGLARPLLPWHTNRTRVGELAGALGTAAGVVGKVARDVTLLAGSDAGELSEASPGASSAMPHKRNPVASVSALACAAQAPGLVATLLAAMVQEHQRAAGAWQAEWRPLRELLVAVGSAAAWLHRCLAGLRVHPDAMAGNLRRLPGEPAGGPGRTGAAAELVDRALAALTAPGADPPHHTGSPP